jgi:hypothetical protein
MKALIWTPVSASLGYVPLPLYGRVDEVKETGLLKRKLLCLVSRRGKGGERGEGERRGREERGERETGERDAVKALIWTPVSDSLGYVPLPLYGKVDEVKANQPAQEKATLPGK